MGRTQWLGHKIPAIADMVHWMIQGVLIPLLISFLTSPRLKNDKKLFTAYIIYINGLTFMQTIVQLYDILDYLDSRAPSSRPAVLILTPVLNVTLGASVQLFFIFRCWRIYKQRVLFVLPLLALWLTGFIPGLFLGYYLVESLKKSTLEPASIALAVWIFSSFVLELCVTITTVVYLFRTRTGLPEHNNVFKTVWQVTWVSAALPPILMVIVIINGYIVNNLGHPVTAVTVDMTGKAYALSLMLSIVGRGYIRAQLDNSIPKSGVAPVLTVMDNVPPISVTREESSAYELESRGPAMNGAGSQSEVMYPQDTVSLRSFRSKPIMSGSESTCTHQIQLPQ
ncbi:hypothetical protein OPQ81_009315 [Rhizoctonia solani]|nr:hypothetical protein OPQ81_009315 [Rhizoctonia solani]